MPPHMQQMQPQRQLPQQQHYQQMLNQQMQNRESFMGSIDYNAIIYGNRDTLVLLLLYIILLTPQINNLMVKIPYTSDNGFYPNYLGILVRGLLFIGVYISMKKFKLI
jgi:hypothetical protein